MYISTPKNCLLPVGLEVLNSLIMKARMLATKTNRAEVKKTVQNKYILQSYLADRNILQNLRKLPKVKPETIQQVGNMLTKRCRKMSKLFYILIT